MNKKAYFLPSVAEDAPPNEYSGADTGYSFYRAKTLKGLDPRITL